MEYGENDFAAWKQAFGKTYTGVEHAKREGIWRKNLQLVQSHNADETQTFTLAMNNMADLENEEYQRFYLGKRASTMSSQAIETFVDDGRDLPDSVNWRLEGVSGPVKDQGQCGSCWAFSAVATMEGAYNLKHNGSIPSTCTATCGPNKNPCCTFSEQEIVDCTLKGADTCNLGGEMHDGIMEIATNHGGKINTEKQYPYTGKSTKKCKADDSSAVNAGIKGYANVTGVGMQKAPYGNETALKAAIAQKPVISVGIDASSFKFQLYSKGIYNAKNCKRQSDQLDHGVSLIGYGTSSGSDYWVVKNSWNAGWGMDGYIWMTRGTENQCGIATDATYALI